MTSVLKKSAYKHGYLILLAAWLYTLSFVLANYFAYDSSPQKAAELLSAFVKDKEDYFSRICNDSVFVSNIASDKLPYFKRSEKDDEQGIFAYAINDRGNPIQLFWNTNTMLPAEAELKWSDGAYSVHHQNGYFLYEKRTILSGKQKYVFTTLIPIFWNYTIETDDVKSQFPVSVLGKKYSITSEVTNAPIVTSGGQTIFYIEPTDKTSIQQAPGPFSIFIRVIAIVLLLIFINSLASDLTESISFKSGFIFLLITIVVLRTFTYFVSFPFKYDAYELFQPEVYASNALFPSLGDLLINSALLFWIVSFLKNNFYRFESIKLGEKLLKVFSLLSLLALPFITFEIAGSLSSLVKDSSKISFNVTNFFELNIYTAISFIIMCLVVISYYYIVQLLAKMSVVIQPGIYWRILILLSFSLFLLNFKLTGDSNILYNFILIAWLLLFYFFIDLGKSDFTVSFYNSAYFMPWSIFLVISVSALLIFQYKSIEEKKRNTIAENLRSKSDFASATMLHTTMTEFDRYIKDTDFGKFYNEHDNFIQKRVLTNNNFSGYLNNFYTRIFTYSKDKKPLYNEDSTSFNVLNSIIATQAKETEVPELYSYENKANGYSYIIEKEGSSADSNYNGYIFLIIRPRGFADEDLKPQLFKELTKDEPLIGSDYAYAIYNKNILYKTSGNYDFTDSISAKEVPKFEKEYRSNNGYNELWYNAGDNKVVVVAHENQWVKEAITFFAYLFVVLVVLILIQHFGSLIIKTHFKWDEIRKIFRFNIRSQIQAIIVAVSVISFSVIAVAIISFFIITFNSTNDKRLRSTSQIIVNEIEQLTGNNLSAEDFMSLNNLDLKAELENKILNIGIIHNTNINFFDVSGNLLVSSQQYVFDNAIISRKMNPEAYYALHYERSTQYIMEENVLDITFKSIYVPVKGSDNSTFAYLNIPFINTEEELKQEISNFLVTILDLNALIFIIAGGIAIWVTKRITTSFTLISDKMRAVSFGATENEEIEWKKDDELGELITEYNKMVRKLAESAKALAQSEREGAWREMARQVAHEIKNPLTPMKLSIQYLQRAIDNNAPNVKQLSNQVATTLVEQIDQLSKIAGDFSQFANISNVTIEIFNLEEVLAGIVQLYSADDRIQIIWNKEPGNYFIEADRTQINRLFTNLIKNAIEAYTDVNNSKVIINQSVFNGQATVSVQDFGNGIPVAMRPKIFTPNFTTKSSGTGLGLAICKGIVEKANGHIWFETQDDVGTTFFVTIPSVAQPE